MHELTIERNIKFHGWLDHIDVHFKLRTCDCAILPGIREFGGGGVIESMALGHPGIVADYGGPAELVDRSTGIRVAFIDEASLFEGLTGAIFDVRLLSRNSTGARLGRAEIGQ